MLLINEVERLREEKLRREVHRLKEDARPAAVWRVRDVSHAPTCACAHTHTYECTRTHTLTHVITCSLIHPRIQVGIDQPNPFATSYQARNIQTTQQPTPFTVTSTKDYRHHPRAQLGTTSAPPSAQQRRQGGAQQALYQQRAQGETYVSSQRTTRAWTREMKL